MTLEGLLAKKSKIYCVKLPGLVLIGLGINILL